MKKVLIPLFLLLSGCCTVSSEDYPVIPNPEPFELFSVSGKVTEEGVLFTKDEYKKVITNINLLQTEIDILRGLIKRYNEWATRKRD